MLGEERREGARETQRERVEARPPPHWFSLRPQNGQRGPGRGGGRGERAVLMHQAEMLLHALSMCGVALPAETTQGPARAAGGTPRGLMPAPASLNQAPRVSPSSKPTHHAAPPSASCCCSRRGHLWSVCAGCRRWVRGGGRGRAGAQPLCCVSRPGAAARPSPSFFVFSLRLSASLRAPEFVVQYSESYSEEGRSLGSMTGAGVLVVQRAVGAGGCGGRGRRERPPRAESEGRGGGTRAAVASGTHCGPLTRLPHSLSSSPVPPSCPLISKADPPSQTHPTIMSSPPTTPGSSPTAGRAEMQATGGAGAGAATSAASSSLPARSPSPPASHESALARAARRAAELMGLQHRTVRGGLGLGFRGAEGGGFGHAGACR